MSLIHRMTQQEELRFGRGHSACGRGKRNEAPAPETTRPPPLSRNKAENQVVPLGQRKGLTITLLSKSNKLSRFGVENWFLGSECAPVVSCRLETGLGSLACPRSLS